MLFRKIIIDDIGSRSAVSPRVAFCHSIYARRLFVQNIPQSQNGADSINAAAAKAMPLNAVLLVIIPHDKSL